MKKSNKVWNIRLIDPKDGSGDALVEIPDELSAAVGWIEGKFLDLEKVNNCVVIKKLKHNYQLYN